MLGVTKEPVPTLRPAGLGSCALRPGGLTPGSDTPRSKKASTSVGGGAARAPAAGSPEGQGPAQAAPGWRSGLRRHRPIRPLPRFIVKALTTLHVHPDHHFGLRSGVKMHPFASLTARAPKG